MYEVIKITEGVQSTDKVERDYNIAFNHALSESRTQNAVFIVWRQGFGDPIAVCYRGSVVSLTEALRLLTQPSPSPINVSPVAPPLEEEAPRRNKPRRTGPEETKARQHEHLTKQVGAFVVKAAVSDDGLMGIVDSVVSVLGVLDDGDDIIDRGSFVKTLTEHGSRVRVLDSHNSRSVRSAVGKPLEMREIGRNELPLSVLAKYPEATGGLLTSTQFSMTDPDSKAVFDRINMGWVNEWSIGFDLIQSFNSRVKWVNRGDHNELLPLDPTDPPDSAIKRSDGSVRICRFIKEIRLWEYSPVLWGMNPATATAGVKDNDPAAIPEEITPEDDKEMGPNGATSRMGDYLMGHLSAAADNCINPWLYDGLIDAQEYAMLKSFIGEHVTSLRAALPDDLALRPMPSMDWFMFGGGEPTQHKEGRVLSTANLSKITQAADLLSQVVKSAGLEEESVTPEEEQRGLTPVVTPPSAGPHDDAPTSTDSEAGPHTSEAAPDKESQLAMMLRYIALAESEINTLEVLGEGTPTQSPGALRPG